MDKETKQKTPRPHAELIKAWADGAEIEIQRFNRHLNKWEDCLFPLWIDGFEYRIKPEESTDKTWKPKKGDYCWWINAQGEAEQMRWDDYKFHGGLLNHGNCFPTKESAEIAAEAVKLLLFAIRENKSFSWGRENDNANAQPCFIPLKIDGKPLSCGEVELVKALRDYRITKIYEDKESILVGSKSESRVIACASHIAFWSESSDEDCEERIREALKQIKEEQEAKNG